MLHRQELTVNHVAWGPKNAGKSSRRWLTARCCTSCSRTRNSTSSRWQTSKMTVWASSSSTERRIVTGRQCPQFAMVWAAVTETGRSPLLFEPSGVKLNSQRYIADIWGLPAALRQEALPKSFLVHATELCTLSLFQENPILDSEESSLIHKLGSLACNEPWPQPFGLLHLVNSGEKGVLLSPPNCGGS